MSKIISVCLLLVAAPLCGCSGDSGPATAPVSGTVFMDGKPLAGVEINFVNQEQEFAGFAKTNLEGNYTLVQGAAPGKNVVTFSKLEGKIELNPEEGMDEGQLEAMGMSAASMNVVKQVIPADYTAGKSKISFEVPDGGTDSANFQLTSR